MRIKTGTLIFVAAGTKMRLFRNDGPADNISLAELLRKETENPPTHEQGTDTPGRTHSRVGTGRSSYSETDWHRQAEDEFARHAATALEDAAAEENGSDILVVAAPRTLGELRKHYGRETRSRLLSEIDKDLANQPPDGIIKVINSHTGF
jgi:protein required for attachment to host cells